MTSQLASPDQHVADPLVTVGEGIETCDVPEGLAAITRSDTELVIWRRSLPLDMRAWLEGLPASCIPDLRISVRPRDLRPAIRPHLANCGIPPGDMLDSLIEDIEVLVSMFATIVRAPLVDIGLKRINHDSCWKFHRDCVEARLLTTYLGPATEWVQPIYGEQAIREQKGFKGPIEQLQNHDVALFKGNCAGPGGGIVHRSPPITGTDQTRLLLCLNKQSSVSPEPWPNYLE
ncbi:MAG: DUF1826 domain-containing protein [Pseudomonadota bacterium]